MTTDTQTSPFVLQPASARPRLRRRGWLRELVETLLLIVAIYALVNLASARFIVEGPSMQPNFYNDQFIIVSRLNYMFSDPQRGDIVVFHNPENTNEDYIKRVIGLPGDTVEIRNREVYVNGERLNEPYIPEECRTRCNDQTWVIGPDEYFVMGDNRNHSLDSRAIGPIPHHLLVGEALVRYWPPQSIGIVRRLLYPEGTNP